MSSRPRSQPAAAAPTWLCGTLVLCGGAAWLDAQELEPRAFVNTPVGMNFVLAGYGYSRGDVVFSPSSPLEDGNVETHAGVLAYVRAVDFWGLSGKVGAVVPFADASGSARVDGVRYERDVFGLADPTLRLSVNLFGAPALSMEEFSSYEQDLVVGVAVDVSAPLGDYDSSKLLNIGTNRWTVKPTVGVSQGLGPLTLEMSGTASVFTRNDDFFNGQTFDQEPLYSIQGHAVYEFKPGLWAAFDATYYGGGRPSIDREEGEVLGNARLGLTLALPVNRFHSIKLFGNTGVYTRTGTDFATVGIAWQVRWGGGL